MPKLYYIENVCQEGFAASLARISDDDLPKIRAFIEDLNKNAIQLCMPKIALWRIINEDDIQECEPIHSTRVLYMGGKAYRLANGLAGFSDMERVV
jgi:hypothetical protein